MAVQKSRKSPSRRGMRRSHDRLTGPTLSEEQTTGEIHRRHHVSAEGFYRGRQVVEVAPEFDDEELED
ncbi:MAG TPA: 50S ribosomal protein L32 [Wenzhouxiangella sp.]|nr:50S ribosomal protein L32 [Wenzhouxiangella sp.]HLS04863.1 50S ribosomal protein L32 [Wenzhouxiangella sp.]